MVVETLFSVQLTPKLNNKLKTIGLFNLLMLKDYSDVSNVNEEL